MLFSTFEFIFCFLPIVIGVFYILQKYNFEEYKGNWLLLCSLGFYLFWNPHDSIPLIISTIVNFSIYKIADLLDNKKYLVFGIMFNLLFLSWFKYPDLIFSHQHYDSIPLGISFYTFTQITFLVSRYNQAHMHVDFTKYALFVSYFPHLVCGPILIFKDFYSQIVAKNKMLIKKENVVFCLFFFTTGLFKKTFIADPLGLYASSIFDGGSSALDYKYNALAVLCYSLQIYADFSGYSDMAVGLSKLFNISIPFNFNSPYRSQSIIEFWRRWHISLSSFLKNYLYIPLGGNEKGRLRQCINLLLVMAIGGIWHGSNVTFLIWGFYHGLLLAVNHWLKNIVNFRFLLFKKLTIVKSLAVFILVSIGWVIFRSHNWDQAYSMFTSLIFLQEGLAGTYFTTKWQYIAVILGIMYSFVLPETQNSYDKIFCSDLKNIVLQKNVGIIGGIIGFLFMISILALNKPQQFLYSGF